jgi:hypothetical protein
VTTRTKQLLLVLIAVGWVGLGVVNLVKDRPALGILYVSLGIVSGLIALSVRTGRRSR